MANAMLQQPSDRVKLINFHHYFTQNPPVPNNYLYQFYYNCSSSEIKYPSIYDWGKTRRLTYTTFKEGSICHVFGLIEFFHTHRLITLQKRSQSDIPQIQFYNQSEPYFRMIPKLRQFNHDGFHRFIVDPKHQKPKWQRYNAKTRYVEKNSKKVMDRQEERLKKIDPKWIEISMEEIQCEPHALKKVPNSKPRKASPNTPSAVTPVPTVAPPRAEMPRMAKTIAQHRISGFYADEQEPTIIPYEPEQTLHCDETPSEVSLGGTTEDEIDKELDILQGIFDKDEYLPDELVDGSDIWV